MECYHCGSKSIFQELDGSLVCLPCSRVQNPIKPLPRVRDAFLPGLWKAEDRGSYTRRPGITNPLLDDRGKYERKRKSHQVLA